MTTTTTVLLTLPARLINLMTMYHVHQVIIGLAAFKKKAATLLVGARDTFGQEGIGEGGGGVSVQAVKEAQVDRPSCHFVSIFPLSLA